MAKLQRPHPMPNKSAFGKGRDYGNGGKVNKSKKK